MKTALNWFSVAAALIAVSCAKEMVSFHVSDARYGTLVACWADDPESRTEIQPDGTTVMWTGEERINVFFGPEYGAEFVSMRYGNRKETEFAGLFPKESADGPALFPEIWALYPYDGNAVCDGETIQMAIPSHQEVKMGSFVDNFFPAIAKTADPEQPLTFYNVCGGACFSVTEVGIGMITFTALGGEALAGTFKVGFNASGEPEVSSVQEGFDTVVLMAPEGGFSPGKQYYVTFFPRTLSKGLSIQLHKGRSVAEKRIECSLTVNRSRFGRLDRVDEGLEYVEDTTEPDPSDIILFADARVKSDCVAAFDTNVDGELSYQEAAAANSLAGVFHSKLGTSFDEFRYFTGITEIPDGGFKDWALLKRITLPEGLVSIGANAFWGCRSLKSMNISTTLSDIGFQAFHDCTSMTEISVGNLTQWLDLKFPSIINRIEYYESFPFWASGEGHLLIDGIEPTSITIPDGFSTVRVNAFLNVHSIIEVTLPVLVKTIGNAAFSECPHLTKVNFDSIQQWIDLGYDGGDFFDTSKEGHIFVSGEEIKSVTVPESVTTLGPNAFSYCSGLDCIILEPIIPPAIGSRAFLGITCPVYVWEGCIDLYLSDSNWKNCWKLLRVNPNTP